MYKTVSLTLLTFAVSVCSVESALGGDWPEWRGPSRDAISKEKGLPEKWSLAGEGLAWKVPYGGRSAPVVLGNHLYLQNTYFKDDVVQERVMCFDADTGKVLWEYKFNVFQSDVPMHRVAWASPAADAETGNVYAFGAGGTLIALTRDGKLAWERSINQDVNLFTTHGGRTVSPIIDGNLVIVASASSSWGAHAARQHRFMALNKKTGEMVWISAPGTRPYDTTYSGPIITEVNGTRLMISGSGDGGVQAVKAQTGEPVWNYTISRRGINTTVVMSGKNVIITHSEENPDSSEMGMIAAVDATGKGKLGQESVKWSVLGIQAGYSSPLVDGDRVYQLDNGANLFAFDAVGGKQLWKQNLGSSQKASPVFADGKIYVGTESGKFYILKPHQDRCEILNMVEMPISEQGLHTERVPEPILATAAVARGRVYFASIDTLYAIGPKQAHNVNEPAAGLPFVKGEGAAAWVQVLPTEITLKPGQSQKLTVRLFDAKGNFLREDTSATWSLEGLKGTAANGSFTAANDNEGQAGLIKATVGGVTGSARARIVPNFPWSIDFDSMADNSAPVHWIGATAGRYLVQPLEGAGKVLAKVPNESLFKRMRIFLGDQNASNYTVEADVQALEKRRQLGDVGITAQTYSLVLFGNTQKLEMWPWQESTKRVESVPFQWKANTWYHLKLRVQNQPDGSTRIQGKAWPKGEAEPEKWMIEKVDTIPNRKGSPGLFADAQFGAYFDNLKVTANQ